MTPKQILTTAIRPFVLVWIVHTPEHRRDRTATPGRRHSLALACGGLCLQPPVSLLVPAVGFPSMLANCLQAVGLRATCL